MSVQGTGLQIRGEALSPSTASVSGSDHKVLGRASPSAPLTVKAALLIPLGQPHPRFPLARAGRTRAQAGRGGSLSRRGDSYWKCCVHSVSLALWAEMLPPFLSEGRGPLWGQDLAGRLRVE